MAKGGTDHRKYKYPLPIHPIDDLPYLNLNNPLSWLFYLYKCYRKTNLLPRLIHVEITGDEFKHILVREHVDMMYLWENGFFGTGQLSRSGPSFRQRNNKVDEDNVLGDKRTAGTASDNGGVALERVTEVRRLQRLEFKKEREKLEKRLQELRQRGDATIEEENELLLSGRENLRKVKELLASSKPSEELPSQNLTVEPGKNEHIEEALELLPVEALFLSFALPVIDIPAIQLLRALVKDFEEYSDSLDRLLLNYVAYHHYRSHGWCVRSGIKFGCDYLLYRRGPPFQHAEFCIMVMSDDESRPYTWYSTVARVASGAKKTLVLCYIEKLVSEEEILRYLQTGQLHRVFGSFKVGEVIYKRWVPGRNRD